MGKPVLVMRDVTERMEAIDAGTVLLVGSDREKIFSKASILFQDEVYYQQFSQAENPYGDGNACRRIVEVIQLAK